MIIDHDGIKPIYVQIAEWLETEIMNASPWNKLIAAAAQIMAIIASAIDRKSVV